MDNTETHVSEIESLVPPSFNEIPFILLERQNNRTTKLVANSGQTAPIEGKNIKFKYEFKEEVFLSHIMINVDGYNEFDRFQIETVDVLGKKAKIDASPKEGVINADIDRLCKNVSFEPPRAWFRKPILQSVELFGFQQSETGDFIRFAYNLDDLKEEAVKEIRDAQGEAQKIIDSASQAQESLDSLNSQISDAKSALSATQADGKNATNQLNEIIAKTGASVKQLEATEERLSNLQSDIKVETQKKEQLQADIVSSETRLRELEGNINLFPSEISGFVDQASINNRLYLNYSLGPIAIICFMFFLLISGAVDLTTVITSSKDVNLAAIIVSRAPYVAVATAIIYACYRIAKIFITEVMNINRQRLSLTKVSIIAKDISQAAESGLKLTPEQIYSNRLKVKMAFLGDHISNLINAEPDILFPENLFSPIGSSDQDSSEPTGVKPTRRVSRSRSGGPRKDRATSRSQNAGIETSS